ncbi:MAG: hypothetical protein BroJett030_32720 [Alphaproteobacteria bacterium]|nr:MAG: hypothetical protein BroJett030_32720 [Alphaproteobacteria bacterium]
MADYLSLLSFETILELPWYVGVPGLLAVALLVLSAVTALLALKPVKAIVRLVLALAIVVILSRGGAAISQLIGGAPPPG